MDLDNMRAQWQVRSDFPSFNGSVDNILEAASMVNLSDESLKSYANNYEFNRCSVQRDWWNWGDIETTVSVASDVWKEFHWIIKWF